MAMATTCFAEGHAFQIDMGIDASELSTSSIITNITGGNASRLTTTSADEYQIAAIGTWFIGGLNDDDGPLSRAAFVSMASQVRMGIGYGDIDSHYSVVFSGPFDAIVTSTNELRSINALAEGKFVSQSSGWYGLAGFRYEHIENKDLLQSNVLARRLSAGFGKYVGERTAIDVQFISNNDDLRGSTNDLRVNLSHISNRDSFNYGVDLAVSSEQLFSEDYSADLSLSVFPTRRIEFGVDIVAPINENSNDFLIYGAHLSWFANSKTELFATYRKIDLDTAASQIDTDHVEFKLGFGVRF